jgi:TolA-binding protein
MKLFFFALIVSVTLLPPSVRAENRELPLFPEDYAAEGEDPFKTILEAYHAGRFARAVMETEQLMAHLSIGPLSETASFLLGDLHLKWAQTGGSNHLHDALAAFKEAQLRYPDSDNAVRGLWRIGQTYEKLGLYYESIGSFKRILLRHPNSRFASLARIGMAETYLGWKKWEEAKEAYEQIDFKSLSKEDQASLLLGRARSLYHLEHFEAAYQKYEQGRALQGGAATPTILFQHAESAYRSGRAVRAREIFFDLLTLHPSDPLSPIALAKTGDTWRREARFDQAAPIYARVQASSIPNSSGGLDKLVASIGQLAMQECADADPARNAPAHIASECESCGAAPPRKGPPDCQAIRDRKEILEALERMEKQAIAVMAASPLNDAAPYILLDAIEQFRRYGAFPVALEVENHLLALLPPSFFRLRLAAVYRKTIGEEIDRLAKEEDPLNIVALFHARSSDFTPPMLTGPTGLQVGISHLRLGLYAQAIDLLSPIAATPSSPLSEEALFFLGKSFMEKGDDRRAEQKFRAYLKRYPKGRRISSLLIDLGTVLDRQGDDHHAIETYHDWLRRYPNHPDAERVSLLLAKTYRRKGDFRKEAALYLKWMHRHPATAADLALLLGDAYYRMREYQKAIQIYEKALKEKPETGERDWIQLQIAKSYHALGQRGRGRSLFDQLAQNAKDPLVRQMAAETVATLNLRSVTDGDRRKKG